MQNIRARIVVLGTGGTIAGRAAQACDAVGYRAAELGISELVCRLPLPRELAIDAEQVAQLDSKDMDVATWQLLARRASQHLARPEVQAVVVTHGTDTLEESAWFLHRVLAPAKPLVLTAAMRPATSLQADGPQNLVDALTLAAHAGACGVLVAMAGRVHGAADVRKHHSWRLDAFDSGDAGPVATVEQGRVRQFRAWPVGQPLGLDAIALDADSWPWVEIVTSHAAASGRGVEAWAAAGVQGLVVAGTGNGSVHQALGAALRRAAAHGVAIRRVTRCASGPVVSAAETDWPAYPTLGPAQARVELQLELMQTSRRGHA